MSQKKYRMPRYSALMCVYDQEIPAHFNDSLESMLMQTYPPSDFVLVCDGKLTCELNIIAKSFQSEFRNIFQIVRIDENIGEGKATNKGIMACKCDYIVKMDSDDISMGDRCEKEMMLFATHPEVDICGAFVEEFDRDTGETIAVKKTPVKHKDIKKFARRRNPFNRQTLAFKRSKALECGGYSELEHCSDYEFAVRMLNDGAKGRNIPEVLCRYRVSKKYRKKKNWRNTKSFIAVRHRIHRMGYSNLLDFLVPCLAQLALFILPYKVTEFFYRKFLR